MIYHKQDHLHIPDTYPAGSCYPTVYACLLDLPLNQVPYFNLFFFDTSKQKNNFEKYIQYHYEKEDYDCDIKKQNIESFIFSRDKLWNEARNLWLISMGYTEDFIADHEKWLNDNPERPYIAAGISPRNVAHVVIFQNGRMIHDPHPSNDGLIKIDYYSYLRKIEGDYEFDEYYIK